MRLSETNKNEIVYASYLDTSVWSSLVEYIEFSSPTWAQYGFFN